jgi:hypothetical protein
LAALEAEGLRRGEEVVFADAVRAVGTGETGVGEARGKSETAYRAEVRVGVLGVRRGSDAGAAVVGLGEAGAGGGDSSGAQGVEGGRGVVGDHAAFHKAKVVGEVGLRWIYQPPHSSERNPAERVFAEVRRWVEGRRYEIIEAKQAAVEAVLRRLEAEGKVSSLVGWHCIRRALNALPS